MFRLTGVQLGGSRHLGTAFLACRFDRARLFDARWEGCKLTGVRLDLVQAVQVVRAHGALVAD